MFLNVRAKSVGETVDISVICPDDMETTVNISIDIDRIKVQKTKGHKNIIKIDDDLSMKLKCPSLEQFVENNFEIDGGSANNLSESLSMISSSVEMIYDKETSWQASEYTKEELDEFIEQLNTKQFKEIETFFTTMPKLSHKVMIKNPKTGVESEVVIEGLAGFFA